MFLFASGPCDGVEEERFETLIDGLGVGVGEFRRAANRGRARAIGNQRSLRLRERQAEPRELPMPSIDRLRCGGALCGEQRTLSQLDRLLVSTF